MKTRNLLLTGLAVVLFSACNDEMKDPIDNGGEVQGYLSLSISTPETRTRTAGGSEGTDDGDPAESAISGVTVVLTDNAGIIKKVVPAGTTNFSGGKTDKFKVPVGTYRVYTLVNMPVSGITLTPESNIQQVISVLNATEATKGYFDGSFFMVNAKHNGTTNAGEAITISPSNDENNPATATVKVDRVAVKIVPETSTPTITDLTEDYGSITTANITGYLLLNVNKQFNLVQAWGTANVHNPVVNPLASEALQTPLYDKDGGALVGSQYFHNIHEYTTVTKDAVTGDVTAIEDLMQGATLAEVNGTPIYVTENRPTIYTYGANRPTSYEDETTGLIYRVQTNLSTFYVYKNDLYTSIAALEIAYGVDPGDFVSVPVEELRAKGIKVYEDGVMYYTYFIRGTNNNANHFYNSENYYGVFRNSVYKLTVNSIKNIGDDVPGGGTVDPENPGPPIDADEAYIEVSVTVNPWVLNTIGIDF